MGRPVTPCAVPGCKGRLERGKHPDGETREWCAVCERRILQLRAIHDPPPAPPVSLAPREISDAQLMQLVQERTWNLSQAAKATKRGMNLLRAAVKAGDIPAATIGRYAILPRGATEQWATEFRRKTKLSKELAVLAALPRSAAKAVTIAQWARAVQLSEATVHRWAKLNRKRPEVQTAAKVWGERAVLVYWWQEGTHA